LKKILAIQPKYYNYIDFVKRGNKEVIGFISQQVEEVEPLAVLNQSDFIPNVYKYVDIVDGKINLQQDDLNVGDEIEIWLQGEESKRNFKIISINNNEIEIDENITNLNCFFYGKKVYDFKVLNKDYIFTLNVSATQELYKLIEKQNLLIQDLQTRISVLESK
jgi:arginine/ornithine N-succinyltransferase beta subunit